MEMMGMMGTGEMLPELQALLLPLLGLLLREPRGLRCTWRVSSFKCAIVGMWDFFAYPGHNRTVTLHGHAAISGEQSEGLQRSVAAV